MTAQIIDGKQIAADMRAELKNEVAKLKKQRIVPGLGVILVGEDPASKSYVTAKERACEDIGIYSDDNRLAADTSQTATLLTGRLMGSDWWWWRQITVVCTSWMSPRVRPRF